MAKIQEYRELPLDDLVIGKGQVRTHNPGEGIEELADSIRVQGLLQPIVVCQSVEPSKWEILTGQRRYLAHRFLQMETIAAGILDERVDEQEAKAVSITENVIRKKLSGPELIDGVTFLYNRYGSQKAVHEATGLPLKTISDYVKFPRLIPRLKEMVESGEVNVNVALKAQDAATDSASDDLSTDLAVSLAKDMERMTGAQRKKFVHAQKENPEASYEEKIERAKSAAHVTQIVVTLSQDSQLALRRYADEESLNQDEAAAGLIERALQDSGFLEE